MQELYCTCFLEDVAEAWFPIEKIQESGLLGSRLTRVPESDWFPGRINPSRARDRADQQLGWTQVRHGTTRHEKPDRSGVRQGRNGLGATAESDATRECDRTRHKRSGSGWSEPGRADTDQ